MQYRHPHPLFHTVPQIIFEAQKSIYYLGESLHPAPNLHPYREVITYSAPIFISPSVALAGVVQRFHVAQTWDEELAVATPPRSFNDVKRRTLMLRHDSSRFLLRRTSAFVRCSSLNRLLNLRRITQSKLKRTGTKAETVSLSSKQSRSNFARTSSCVHMSRKVLLRERQISKTLGHDLAKRPINREPSPLAALANLNCLVCECSSPSKSPDMSGPD
jgi:hypothetical protein